MKNQQKTIAELIAQIATHTVLTADKKAVDWTATGANDGKTIDGAQVEIAQVLIVLLIERAKVLAGNDTANDWLRGYGESRGNVRKSEAKAVIEAYAKEPEAVEIAAETVEGQGVGKASRYSAFITKCREIRGIKGGGKPEGSKNGATAGQVEKAQETALKADGTQAVAIMQDAAKRVTELKMPEALIVASILNMVGKMAETSENPIFKEFAVAVQAQGNAAMQRHQKELDDAKAAKAAGEAGKGTVPTPAEAEAAKKGEAKAA
jgi:hypothetical protein